MNMSGLDPEVAVANFSSLPLSQKHELVTELIKRSRYYRWMYVKFPRNKKKEFHQRHSCLNKEELMMIGDLDQEEADNLSLIDVDQEEVDNQSLNSFYLSSESEDEDEDEDEDESESEDEPFVCRTFQDLLHARDVHQLMAGLTVQSVSSYNREFFVDKRFNESDDDRTGRQRFILRGHEVNSIGVDVGVYRRMMEHHPRPHVLV